MESKLKPGQALLPTSDSAKYYGKIYLIDTNRSSDIAQTLREIKWKVSTEKGIQYFYEASMLQHFKLIEEATPEELEEAKTGLRKWLEGG